MNLLLVPVLVPLYFFLPGYLFSRIFFRHSDTLSAGERLFVAVASSVCLTTWLALTLAEFGAFSLLNIALSLLVLCAVGWLWARKRLTEWTIRDAKPDWLFLTILALAVLLFARPAEYVIGNSDAGTYINTGASIAQTGALAIHDAQVAQLAPDLARTFYWQLTNPYMLYTQVRQPGFFIADQSQGLVLPQFLHLYPAWLAIWDALLGVQPGLFATPIIGVLGSVAFYLLVNELFGKNVARLAFFLLVVCVPQFWFARYPVAEALTQFLMLTGMFALLKMTRLRSAGFGILAGVAFGELFLVRSDSVLFIAPLVLYGLVLLFFRRWQREHWAFFGVLGIVFTHAFLHILVFAPNYLYYQLTHALKLNSIDKIFRFDFPSAEAVFTRPEYALALLALLAVGLLVLFGADRIFQMLRTRWGETVSRRFLYAEPYLRIGGAALPVLLVAAFYFVLARPETLYAYVGGITPTRSEANLIKLGWYLSPIGVLLATLGAVIIVIRRDLSTRTLFFYGTAAMFSFFYLDELYSNPHYIYTVRHYIPLVIPLFILCAARALQWLWNGQFFKPPTVKSLARVAAVGAFAVWMLYNLYAMGIVDASRAQGLALRVPFVAQNTALGSVRLEPFEKSIVGFKELGGAYRQVETIAQQLPQNAVIVFAAGRDEPALLATPLKYIFGRDAFVTVFNNPPGAKVAAMIDGWRAQGRQVILAFGTNGGKLQLPNYKLEPLGDVSLDVPQWAFAYEFMPRSAWRVNLNYALMRAVPRDMPETYPFTLHFGGDDFPYLVSGFLERPPEANTRWFGGILAENRKLRDATTLSGVVRIPVPDKNSEGLQLTLRARAPRDNVKVEVKQGKNTLGELAVSQTMDTYVVDLKRAKLDSGAEGYWLELVSETTFDGEGRVLGVELESLTVTRQ